MALKHQLISVTALFLFASLAFAGALTLCRNTDNVFSDVTIANYDYSEGSPPETFELISDYSERIKSEFVTFLSFGEETKIKHIEVTPVYTSYSFAYLMKLNYSGDFFSELHQENCENIAVISENLARELYFTSDAVGKEIELQNKIYKIAGVYKDSRGAVHQLSKDSREKIYIPYTCLRFYEDMPLETIIYDSRSNSAAVIEQLNLPQYNFFSLTSKTKVIETLENILMLTLYIGAVIIFSFVWYKLSSNLFLKLKKILGRYYFIEAVKYEPLTFVLFLLVFLGIPLIFTLVFIASDFSVYIIPEYTPYDNIFDVGYYLGEYLSAHKNFNSLSLAVEMYYHNFYSFTFGWVLWLCVIFLILYVLLIARIYRVLRDNLQIFGKTM